MYQSPINLTQMDVESKIEDAVIKAVQKVGVAVDKEELVRALMYDREQYEKGYRDGLSDAVKHGRWIGRGDDACECSECNAVIEGDEVYWRNNYFCYHCGARMDGK